MTGFTPDVSQWTLIRTGVLQGAGLGFMFVPLSTITFSTLPASLRTQGTALYSLVRNIGSSIGISLVIFLLTRNTQIVHAELAGQRHAVQRRAAAMPAVAQHLEHGDHGRPRRARRRGHASRRAIVAYADDFKLMMIVALAALPLMLLLRRAKAQPGEAAILE